MNNLDNFVITISREFGSGGRKVGEQLAGELGIAFYDKSLIHLAVGKSGLDPLTIEKAEEEASNKFLFNLAIGGYASAGVFAPLNVPLSDQVFFAQSKVIEEIAEQGSCVIIGRCANYVLRGHPCRVSVFVYGEMRDRVRRVAEEFGVTEAEAEARITRMDKGRANYHEHYTEQKWGSAKIYHLAVNTSFTGIDGAVRVIRALVRR
ncbi:MAG: cytidylate kinase-like family protein [Synergistaceae bacterium]|jgi:cytidylate kinase|nr:cytidylate kinase-like family protein [Synergistaceae bacterium]